MGLEPIIANIPRGMVGLTDCLFADGNRCRITWWNDLRGGFGCPTECLSLMMLLFVALTCYARPGIEGNEGYNEPPSLQNTRRQNKMEMDCRSHGSTCRLSLDGSVF
ncbi:hypothetical protein RHSIM_Rhsim10G0134000 [Rhododendron simsii]|uniref:Uncharacterized protein n=1 Tax=Rhododendron simsii TaxID=118357 RepID=A0A834GGX9_RHOSS|nr:hypothetical protein RHSIM_Rhsim10G0134000 [Rhododendron simsii]